MSEENKLISRRVFETALNQGDLSVLDELLSPDLVAHLGALSQPVRGLEAAKQFDTVLRGAFPDIHFTVEDQVAETDKVVTRWIARGTHRGHLMGIPATNRSVTWAGITIHRIADGRVAESWVSSDALGLMQQLGGGMTPNRC